MAGGRPSKYDSKLNDTVYKLALLGATDEQLADVLGVAKSTLNKWKNDFPEFSDSLKKGKDEADAEVAKSLYKRAIGFQVKEEHETVTSDGVITKTIWKDIIPDTTAQIFWLKNRQAAKWRDKQEIDHSGVTFEITPKK